MSAYLPIANNQIKASHSYLISGEESLLIHQSVQRIREFANANNMTLTHRFQSNESVKLADVQMALTGQSLFAEGTLVELNLHSANMNAEVKKIIEELSKPLASNCIAIIIAEGIQLKSPAWLKTFEKKHCHLRFPRLQVDQQKRWMTSYLQELKLNLSNDCQQVLLRSTEGNLSALFQEINQLKLEQVENMTVPKMLKRLEDQGKFNAFSVAHLVLSKNAKKAIRMCRNLRRDNHSIIPINWSIYNDTQLALSIAQAKQRGIPADAAVKQAKLWPSRIQQLKQVAQLGAPKLRWILKQTQRIDQQGKGQSDGDEWVNIRTFNYQDCL